MSYAAVSTPTPSRLVRRLGSWALELTRLVPIDGNVLEPRSQRLEGSDAILRILRQSKEHPTLVHSAANLMRALHGDEDRAFIVVDGEWVPSRGEPQPTLGEGDLRAQLADLRAEFVLLRAAHQRLRERVAQLEARLESASKGGLPARIPFLPARAEDRADPQGTAAVAAATPARVATPASPESGQELTQPSSGVSEPSPPVHPFRDVVSLLGGEDGAPDKRINLPEPVRVIAAIGELFGGDPNLTVSDTAMPDSVLELAALYAGRLVDDDGKDLGVLLAELKLVAQIGGKLMGLPATVIEEQARTGILNDQVLVAMSEVVNRLSTAVNEVRGNVHLRGTPVEAFPAEKLDWLVSARQQIALGRKGVGTLWLVGR